jgi:hypothetical protein
LASPPTRLDAVELKATKRPSTETNGELLLPFASAPVELTLTRLVFAAVAKAGAESNEPVAMARKRAGGGAMGADPRARWGRHVTGTRAHRSAPRICRNILVL